MEQIANEMRANRGKLNALGNRRAVELAMEHPQLMDNNMLEPTEPQPATGGGEAGMKRVIGRGRPKKVKMVVEEMKGGCACDGGSNGRMVGGAMEMGRSLGEQMMKLHGPDFMAEFAKGLTAHGGASMKNPFTNVVVQDAREVIKPGKMKGGRGPASAPPSGQEVSHAPMSSARAGLPGQALGGQDVPPGGVAPVAYGSAPQAPASFRRNAVGMGKCGGVVSKKGAEDEKLAMEVKGVKDKTKMLLGRPGHGTFQGGKVAPAGAGVAKMATGGARTARGQAIAKLMKEKGMTLGQASKYLKEHGSK